MKHKGLVDTLLRRSALRAVESREALSQAQALLQVAGFTDEAERLYTAYAGLTNAYAEANAVRELLP